MSDQNTKSEAKVFILSVLLVENIDELKYSSSVTTKIKYQAKRLLKELEEFTQAVETGRELNDLVQEVSTVLDKTLLIEVQK